MYKNIVRLLIAVMCLCISMPVYAANRAFITEGWYKIVPAHAQSKALDVGGAKTNPGANIQLWGYVGAPQQKFYVRHRGDNWYSIKAGNCDLYVDAQGGVPHNGENVHLWNWNGTDAQLWGFIDTTDGFNICTKMQYNLVFDCEAGRGDDGTNIQLWERGDVAWHRWILIPVEAPGSNTSNGESYVVSTNSASLLLRNGPGSGYGIKARMPRGSVVTVYSIQNGWAEVSYNGIRGYAAASYLSKQNASNNATLQVSNNVSQGKYVYKKINIVSSNQIVDSFNGVDAIYTYKNNSSTDSTYNCAALVRKYYQKVYGVSVHNLCPNSRPMVNGRTLNKIANPNIGDIVGMKNSKNPVNGHWAIVKAVEGNQVVLFEQNWKSNGKAPVNRRVNIDDVNFYRL